MRGANAIKSQPFQFAWKCERYSQERDKVGRGGAWKMW